MAVTESVVFSRYGRISYVKSRRRFRFASLLFDSNVPDEDVQTKMYANLGARKFCKLNKQMGKHKNKLFSYWS
jgi:hypothetical protein